MSFSKWVVVVVGCLSLTSALQHDQAILYSEPERVSMNVAVIGAGAGGASTAYFLSKFAAASDINVNITVFERNTYIGGRTTTVNAYNDSSIPVELGASIFVDVNAILVDAVKEFNLSTAPMIADADIPGAALSVWDGKDFVITSNNGWWDTAKLLYKYGLAPIKTTRLVKAVVGKFLKMYHGPAFPFESLTQVAQDVGLLAVTSSTGEQYMKESGITGDFGREIVQASTRVNYAQNLAYIHGLEAMVSMAASNAQSVRGGNWKIFDKMIAASNATMMLESGVKAINKHAHGRYELEFDNCSAAHHGHSRSQIFDTVVLAAPYQFSNVSILEDQEPGAVPDTIPYVRLHVTLLTSPHLMSAKFFNLKPENPAPRVILTTLPKHEKPQKGPEGVGSPGFFSISLLNSVKNPDTGRQEYLYKMFSPSPPNTTFLSHLLGLKTSHSLDSKDVSNKDITWIHRKVWHSYPYEYPRVTFEKIELRENLWYTSGMDSFISTMETNALMGKNVAKLIVEKARKGKVKHGGMRQPTLLPETGSV